MEWKGVRGEMGSIVEPSTSMIGDERTNGVNHFTP